MPTALTLLYCTRLISILEFLLLIEIPLLNIRNSSFSSSWIPNVLQICHFWSSLNLSNYNLQVVFSNDRWQHRADTKHASLLIWTSQIRHKILVIYLCTAALIIKCNTEPNNWLAEWIFPILLTENESLFIQNCETSTLWYDLISIDLEY